MYGKRPISILLYHPDVSGGGVQFSSSRGGGGGGKLVTIPVNCVTDTEKALVRGGLVDEGMRLTSLLWDACILNQFSDHH